MIYSLLCFPTKVLNMHVVIELTKYHESSAYRICLEWERGSGQEARGNTCLFTISSHSLDSFSWDIGFLMTNAFTVGVFFKPSPPSTAFRMGRMKKGSEGKGKLVTLRALR